MFASISPGIISVSDNGIVRSPITSKFDSTSRQKDCCGFDKFFDCLVPFTRVWGLLTAIVLAGVSVDLTFHGRLMGSYLIGGSVFVLLAETTWIVTLFLQLCLRSDNKIWNCWWVLKWFSGWKKSLVYGPLGAIPIIWPNKLWLSYVAGSQLLTLACLHLVHSLNSRKKKTRRKHRLHVEIESLESSKFEEVTDCLNDELPEPIPGSSHSISDSLAEQDTILEI
ncbi:uncharacterized protein [Leptinotarsa decemlineata]|uniref:uncharacterized protein n=1 Tax=Leptinotarsa decemlineata TaxID=7539 RepID=UPI003D305F67